MSPAAYPNIDAYIASFPAEIQAILQKVRETIHQAAPEAVEAIKYQMPTFIQEGSLVHFAALKNSVGFYPTPSGIEAFKAELAPYISTKSALQFPYEQPIPYDLIAKITAFRARENQEKAAAKKRR